jgi:hypothetical protein
VTNEHEADVSLLRACAAWTWQHSVNRQQPMELPALCRVVLAELDSRTSPEGEKPATQDAPDTIGAPLGSRCRIEPCESFGKHRLEVKIDGQWRHLRTDYLAELERMADKINAM